MPVNYKRFTLKCQKKCLSKLANLSWLPLLFWAWVVGVSFWIETASVSDPTRNVVVPNTVLQFEHFRFEQREMNGPQIILHSPAAAFSSETQKIIMENPSLQWTAKNQVYSATGGKGSFLTQDTMTTFPSDFHVLEFTEGAQAKGQKWLVDSERMLFNNRKRIFVLPEPFKIQRVSLEANMKGGYYYNPTTDELVPLDQERLNELEVKS